MNANKVPGWRFGVFLLGLVAAAFHLWLASAMRLTNPIGAYFATSGILFLVAGVLMLVGGHRFLFKLGAGGLVALSAIDNALLYYTRTFGLGFVFALFPSPRPPGPPPSGTPPSGGFRGPPPWTTSWIPPGAVQFFVLQTVIIIVSVFALWRVSKMDDRRATPA